MSSKKISKKGGSSPAKEKMAGGGAPNANGYGKKLISHPISGNATMRMNAAKDKAVAKKKASKPVSIKKKSSKKKAMTDDQFDSYMKNKYGTMSKSEFSDKTENAIILADTANPSNVGKTKKEVFRGGKDEPITMVKNDIVRIPISMTPPKITRTAMIPTGKKGGAMSKMKKMSYRKGGSKKGKMC